ncbi:MAG TPA: allantoate amidohydrolase [Opitutaceae bacterium]|nr:allantoate amidohydrolase [Opitutaceae bacterium]
MSAATVIERCRILAAMSEEPGVTTRTFLAPPTRDVHRTLRGWMENAGLATSIDAVGNVRGLYPASRENAPRFLIGSHSDTVPNAGAYDGVLGIVLAISLLEALGGRRLNFAIEVVAFSEEEGVRFATPFIGSRALVGTVDAELLGRKDRDGITVADAIRQYGLDPAAIPQAKMASDAFGYLEFHIEQGPVLESLGFPLGIVEAIAGQSRFEILLKGKANHAGTTPMNLRHDALAGAAEAILLVEQQARATPAFVATVGRIDARPGAGNVVPGEVTMSLDVRHAEDRVRAQAIVRIKQGVGDIAAKRKLEANWTERLDEKASPMDIALTAKLERAVAGAGYPVKRMVSGAGHDAMVMAPHIPSTMLFLRSPGGISHHPDETVIAEDVQAALNVGQRLLEELSKYHA